MDPAAAPVREGDILADKYRVDRVLGMGGMGVVVAATHLQLQRRVALKFMLPSATSVDPAALERFQREARVAVQLSSEHVAKVLDTGSFADGSPYIVMEYLEGHDLGEHLRSHGPLPLQAMADFMIQTCDAIAEAHSLGMVHRDLKPANLFVTTRRDGSPLVKVLDFGISKSPSIGDGNLAMTKTTSMLGSPLYMSPEQMRSAKKVDHRTDIWALGIIMYELLGGRVPFDSDTLGDLLSKVMMEEPQPLDRVRPDIPSDVCALVNQCLRKDPNTRVQSVADIARALARYASASSQPIVERIATVLRAPVSVSSSTSRPSLPEALERTMAVPAGVETASSWGATGNKAPGKSTPLIVGACALALVAITSIVLVTRKTTPPPPPPVAATPTAPPATTVAPAIAVPATPTTTSTHEETLPPPVLSTPHAAVARTSSPVTKASASATPPRPTSTAKSGIFDTSN